MADKPSRMGSPVSRIAGLNASRAFLGFALLSGLFAGHSFSAQSDQSGEIELQRGLLSVVFGTPAGRLTFNLPDDIAAGDKISGSVIAEPAGSTDVERESNTSRLQGYVVEVEGAAATPQARLLKWNVPSSLFPGAATVLLKDPGGRVVGRAQFPVSLTPAASAAGFQLPRIGQAGRPVEIAGSFDGDAASTAVSVGGRNATILAESPRKTVARCPSQPVGQTTIEVREQGTEQKGEFRTLGVRLSAPRLQLRRGEQTQLNVEVTGVAALQETVSLMIVNHSSSVVSLEGGDVQTLSIDPAQIGVSVVYLASRNLTGVQPGVFDIEAEVKPPPQPVQSASEEAEKKKRCEKLRAGILRLIKEYDTEDAANMPLLYAVIEADRGLGPAALRRRAEEERKEGDRLAAPYLEKAAQYEQSIPNYAEYYREKAKQARDAQNAVAQRSEQHAKMLEDNGVPDDDPKTPVNEMEGLLGPLREKLIHFIKDQEGLRWVIRSALENFVKECYGSADEAGKQLSGNTNHPDYQIWSEYVNPRWLR